jgi:hypothetical protein
VLILRAGRSGLWNDRNCRTVFDLNSVLDLGFWGQMTGLLNFWIGEENGIRMGGKVAAH